MIEFLVVIPVFLVILLNIISFGPFLNVYLTTAHLSHEGARSLSGTPELTPNIRVTTVWRFDMVPPAVCHAEQGGTGFPECDGSIDTGIPTSHLDVHEKIIRLVNILALQNAFRDQQVGVISNYSDANDNVVFTLYGRYRGLTGFLVGNVVVTEEGPYLF